jgi:hypothetical protein
MERDSSAREPVFTQLYSTNISCFWRRQRRRRRSRRSSSVALVVVVCRVGRRRRRHRSRTLVFFPLLYYAEAAAAANNIHHRQSCQIFVKLSKTILLIALPQLSLTHPGQLTLFGENSMPLTTPTRVHGRGCQQQH